MSDAEPAPSFAARAEQHADGLAAPLRKQHGAWFTPMELALPTTRRTLAPLLAARPARPLRIVDPAVGGGAFLRAALRVLRDEGQPTAHALAQLHGLDVDAEAANLAALALCEAGVDAQPDARAVAANVRAGDGLLELESGTFDAVLTNPPWETLQAGADAKARVAQLRPHFRHQGRGKLFTYRLFVERAFELLRPGGRLGLVVPASLWFDRDAEPLRRLLLDACDWQWLFGFENRQRVFAIDSRYRFGVIIATKGGATRTVCTAFGRTELREWAADAPPHVRYDRDELRALSPASGAFVEVDARADLDVLTRMHRGAPPLLGARGVFEWRQGDFNMTADRAQFVLRERAEADGYRLGDDGVFRRHGAPDLLPLYQGAMIHDLHPNAGAHAGGTGHGTAWEAPRSRDELRPLYLVAAAPWRADALRRGRARLVHRALSNATNERTMIACLLPDQPCGNSLGVLMPRLWSRTPLRTLAAHAAVLSSLAFDWALRQRLGGTNLNAFVLADCVVPALDETTARELARLALQLCAILPWHAGLWQQARDEGWADDLAPAIVDDERRELATRIDVLAGRAFGLRTDDVAWIVRGCDRDEARLRARDTGDLPSKGFWRIDRDLPPPQRRPLRWLAVVTSK
jgi:hypothetical protein